MGVQLLREDSGVEFRILGPLEVCDDDRPLALGPPGQRAMLAALVLDAGSVVSIDRLIDRLWGERPPATAPTIVHGYVAGLRRALEPKRSGVLATRPGGYVLDIDPDRIDAVRFERLVGEGRRALADDAHGAASVLCEALSLWRGHPLADIQYDFAYETARRLEDLRLDALEARLEADLALGRHRDVVAELEQLVERHPSRDRLRGLLMLALFGSGRQAEALQAFENARRWMAEELGADPPPQLAALHEAILRQEASIYSLDPAPAGVLTFLLTDIEDSTPMWEREPEAMRVAHARHNAIVRKVASRHRGDQPREQGEGDSAVLVFRRPTDAVACAIDLQRAFADERWPGDLAIKVRMAIHTGEAEQRDGTYHGLAIARCARVRALGHGGQVLISGAAADLVSDSLPLHAAVVDLGLHELKGLSRPERVWQLAHPDLEREFPPLVGSATRGNLPAALTSFLGRSEELTQIGAMLERDRLVTLTGPGGSGKTRLAIEAARSIAGRFPAGVWLVDLVPLGASSLVADAVAEALGVRGEGGRPMTDHIVEALANRDVLIVLDNCEHVLDGCAEVVAAILAGAPGPRMLATSREALSTPGESVYPLAPLALPEADASWDRVASADAVRLFAERASAARPGFAVNASNAQLVSELSRRLDGMPLALELAAARVASLPLRHIVDKLDNRFRLLDSVTRAALPRHRSLAAVVDWSYDLLSADERLLFDRLSVFSGAFDLDTAREVVSGDGLDADEVPELVARLVSRSLLQLEETAHDVRYRALETLRQYGAARLEEREESNALRARHANYFVKMAERGRHRMFLAGSPEWFDHLAAEYDNLRSALEWAFGPTGDADVAIRLACALGFYWEQRSVIRESIHWWQEALRLTEGHQTPERALFLGLAAASSLIVGDFDRAECHARNAYELASAIGPRRNQYALEALSAASWASGIAAWARGDLDRAHDIYTEAIATFDRAEDIWHLVTGEILLARVHLDRGDLPAAESMASRALAHARECGEEMVLGLVLDIGSAIAYRQGDFAQARTLVQEALERHRASGYTEGRASALGVAGRLDLAEGDVEAATAAFEEALDLSRRIGLRGGIASALEGLAHTLVAAGDLEAAALLLGGAAAIREAIGAPVPASDRGDLDNDRARIEADLGPAAFDSAFRRGAAMPLDDLVETFAGGRLAAV